MTDSLAHAPASDLRAGLLADLLTKEEVIAILSSRNVKGPSRRLLMELTDTHIARPKRTIASDDTALYTLVVATDGKARASDWTYTRWALCPSLDSTTPAAHYRNGGPVNCAKPVSGGKQPPMWMIRAVAFVASAGPMTTTSLQEIAEWFRSHRVGIPLDRLAA